jgi:hypothetical protein
LLINIVLKRFLYVSVISICPLFQASSEAGEAQHRFQVDGKNLYFNSYIAAPDSRKTSIEMRDADTLRRILRLNPSIDNLVLTSKGGSLRAAEEIMDTVFEFGLDTTANGPCVSACAIIFLAGKKRQVIGEPQLGFHRPTIDGDAELKYLEQYKSVTLPNYIERVYEIGQRDVLKMVKLLNRQGISPAFLIEAYASPELWYPKRDELVRLKILN